MSTATRAADLDMQHVLEALVERGLADAVVPHLHAAVESLTTGADADATVELSDLLVRLVALGEPDAVLPLITAIETLTRDPDAPPPPPQPIERAIYDEVRERAVATQLDAPGEVGYGAHWGRLDERVVEYPWLFDRLRAVHPRGAAVLDAGSVCNHAPIIERWRRAALGPLSIVTLHHEGSDHVSDDVRYEFADLRRLPYRDEWFASALCLSTLEHVGMDNTTYGDRALGASDPAGGIRAALAELRRVVRPGGRLLVSVPCGAPSDRGWFRIIGVDEVASWAALPGWTDAELRCFRATPAGWAEVTPDGARDAGYNEASVTGLRTAPRWVGAAEAVALLELTATGRSSD